METYLSLSLIFILGCAGQDEMELYKQQTNGKVDTGCYIGAYLYELDQLNPGEEDHTTLSSRCYSFCEGPLTLSTVLLTMVVMMSI